MSRPAHAGEVLAWIHAHNPFFEAFQKADASVGVAFPRLWPPYKAMKCTGHSGLFQSVECRCRSVVSARIHAQWSHSPMRSSLIMKVELLKVLLWAPCSIDAVKEGGLDIVGASRLNGAARVREYVFRTALLPPRVPIAS